MRRRKRGTLRRRLGPVLLVLYGTGVTVGAGIYVLVGPVAAFAGYQAPLAFLTAALVMGLTVTSYADLCTRYPVAAGEAAYVRHAFGSRLLSRSIGILMVATAVIASATVVLGASGYVAQLITLSKALVVSAIVIGLGIISIWGVLQSVLLASLFTLIEVGGLLVIVVGGFYAGVPISSSFFSLPLMNIDAWLGIGFASLLAFFAFIGFEDLTNMAEETVDPRRTMPLALTITLVVTTCLYMLVAAVAVTSVPIHELAASSAPLTLVFERLLSKNSEVITFIGIVATLNTILAEMTMATRVVYGMAQQGDLPSSLGRVNAKTATPIAATMLVIVATIALTLLVPFLRLAEATSVATLIVFAAVNLALIRVRCRDGRGPYFNAPLWVPVAGFIASVVMMCSPLFQ